MKADQVRSSASFVLGFSAAVGFTAAVHAHLSPVPRGVLTTPSMANDSTRAPDVIVASVRDIGTLEQSPKIRGRDGGYSAVFQGHEIWSYGDTFLAHANARARGMLSNSWSYAPAPLAGQGIGHFRERLDSAGAPTMLVPESAAEQAFNDSHNGDPCREPPCGSRFAIWPAAIVADTPRHRALIFYSLVSTVPGSFHGLGNGIAVWRDFARSPARPVSARRVVADHPELIFGPDEHSFGSAALIVDGYLYAFGCETPGMSKPCLLARVTPDQILDRDAWTFYAGNGRWSAGIADAVPVFNGNDIVTVSFNEFSKRYLAVYARPFSQAVVMRTARDLEGPWSDEAEAFTARAPTDGGTVYDALVHPEYALDDGRVIPVTYTRGTAPFASEVRVVSLTLARRRSP